MLSQDLEITSVTALLHHWLSRQVRGDGLAWLEQKQKQIAEGAPTRVFFTAFSAVPRYIPKQDLQLTPEDWQAIENTRSGWFPEHWSLDQAARSLIILSHPQSDADQYLQTLERVFSAADVGELVALYQALPLLPYPERLRLRAAEGVRSNMTAVFNAIALRNPYPVEYFDNAAWNQMVLKALFVGSSLSLIQGLDRRANCGLAQMLSDYAHERWAAHRSVSPELWRAMGQFAQGEIIADLERVLNDSDPTGQEAAALALSASDSPQAQQLLTRHPNLQASIEAGLTWDSFTRNRLTASQ